MYLGLDLRGGVHFLLQVDMKGAVTKYLDSTGASIRTTLRGEEDARSSGISREGNSLVIRFRDTSPRDKAQQLIERSYPDLQFVREERGGEYALVGTLKQDAQRRIQDFAIQQNLTTLRNRVNELGVAEPISCPASRTPPRPRRSWDVRRRWKYAWWTRSTRTCNRYRVRSPVRCRSATSCCTTARVSLCC
jgi:preprotein translocase subunit SecD